MLNNNEFKKYENEFILSLGKSNSTRPVNMPYVIRYENLIYGG